MSKPPTNQIIESLRERDALVGWRFDAYNEDTATWIRTRIFDKYRTETAIREQHSPIRNLTPLVPLDAVLALQTDEGHTTAGETMLEFPRDEHTVRWTQLRGTSKSTRKWVHGDDNE